MSIDPRIAILVGVYYGSNLGIMAALIVSVFRVLKNIGLPDSGTQRKNIYLSFVRLFYDYIVGFSIGSPTGGLIGGILGFVLTYKRNNK